MELVSKNLDELTEIHAPVGDVVEYGLGAVALKLHVPDFHVQTELHRNLTRTYHRLLLPSDGLLPLLEIIGLCPAVDFFEFTVLRSQPAAFHLACHYGALKRHYSEIMPRVGLHHNKVAGLYALPGGIVVDALAGVLETDFEIVLILFLSHSRKPVIDFHFAAARSIVAVELALVAPFDGAPARAVIFFCFVIVVFHNMLLYSDKNPVHKVTEQNLRIYVAVYERNGPVKSGLDLHAKGGPES